MRNKLLEQGVTVKKKRTTIQERTMQKLECSGSKEAVRYLANRMVMQKKTSMPQMDIPDYIFEAAVVSAKTTIKGILKRKRARKEKEDEQQYAALMAFKQRGYEIASAFKDLNTDDERLRYYVRLSRDDASFIDDKKLHTKAVAFRKRCVSTTKAREHLQCTLTELNRWDARGDVPHAFKRVLPLAKAVQARFWNIDDLDCVDVNLLREKDLISKKFKRQGLRIVKP